MRLDFRRLGLSLDDMGAGFTFGEAIDLVQGLMVEPGTHVHASVNEWSFPMSIEAYASQLMVTAYVNAHRDKNEQPFRLAWPFPDRDAITPERRAELVEQFKRRSVFRNRH